MQEADANSTLIVQITDCHIEGEPDKLMLGVDTRATMMSVIEQIKDSPRPDIMIVTGDVAGEGEPAAYDFAQTAVDQMADDIRWLPGNHDDTAALSQRFAQDDFFSQVVDGWVIVGMNSSVDGEVDGYIDPLQLAQLQRVCEANLDKALIIFLHHPPMPIGCQWIDPQHIANGLALIDIAHKHKAQNLKPAVICTGHVHQALDTTVMGVRILCCPSTGFQFKPGEEKFKLDDKMPGYREIRLNADSTMATTVHRIPQQDLNIDFSSDGYE